jgi:protein-disulfide isomerase
MESGQTPGSDPTEQERRQRLIKLVGAGVFMAVLAVVILIVASQSGDKPGDTKIEGGPLPELAGLQQEGDTVGDPNAPVTITEYGDLQCPVCKAYSNQVIPELLAGPVKDGQAKLRYRHWTIIGPQSKDAGRAALAAAEQNKLWTFVELFYDNQGPENSGYVTGEFLDNIAEKAGLDVAQFDKDRANPKFTAELEAIDKEATQLHFTGTPSILVAGPGGTMPLAGVPSAADVEQAIAQVSG